MSEFETHEGLPREAEVLRARRESLERLRDTGIEPFAMGFDVNAHAADLLAEFEERLENEEESDRRASVAGRVVLARRHGKLTFLVIRDRTGDLQLFCEEATLGAGYGVLEEIDLGDIVGATGHVVRTRRGELSLKVDSLTILTKALRPLPEKWHGLQDPDLQQRRRYLHLITDPTAREYVAARAGVLRTIRRELDDRGYTEVETPVLQAVAGGALAKPFTTHHNALDTDLKLRISLELYLKRLLVGGLERIYEIGRNFRNEGIDREHNPEFTMLELYEAYGDYGTMMRIAEDLIRASAQALKGRSPSRSASGSWTSRRPSAGSRCWEPSPRPPARRSRSIERTSRSSRIATASPSIPRGSRGRSSWRCSRSWPSTRSSSRRSSATSRGRSLRSPARTGRIRRSPSTSTSSWAGSSSARRSPS